MPINRDLKAEWRELQGLPDSPEKDAALQKWTRSLPVPYVAANLMSTGADPGAKGQEQMAALREQMRLAGAFVSDLDVEMREAHAIARQRLGLTEQEWQSLTTAEMETHLRHHNLSRASLTAPIEQKGGGAPDTTKGKRTRRTPHENPESVLKGKTQVTKKTVASILGVTERQVKRFVDDGKLQEQGEGHHKMITAASLRAQIKAKITSD